MKILTAKKFVIASIRDQEWDRILICTKSRFAMNIKHKNISLIHWCKHLRFLSLILIWRSWCHEWSSMCPPVSFLCEEFLNFFVCHAQFAFTIPWHFRNTNWAHHHHHSIAHNGRSRPIKMNWIPWHGISLFLLIGTISHVGWTLHKSWMSLSLSLAN